MSFASSHQTPTSSFSSNLVNRPTHWPVRFTAGYNNIFRIVVLTPRSQNQVAQINTISRYVIGTTGRGCWWSAKKFLWHNFGRSAQFPPGQGKIGQTMKQLFQGQQNSLLQTTTIKGAFYLTCKEKMTSCFFFGTFLLFRRVFFTQLNYLAIPLYCVHSSALGSPEMRRALKWWYGLLWWDDKRPAPVPNFEKRTETLKILVL